VADGVDGMSFVTGCVASSRDGGAWVALDQRPGQA
jgi:hypothetical protein